MPHSRRLTPPEMPDEERDGESARNQPGSSHHNGEPSPPMPLNRRDENAISFRHFLQPHSDVVPTRHRNSRGANSGAVDLVDGVSMTLPDFVQDHLIAESVVGASGGAAAGPSSSDHLEAAGNVQQQSSLIHHSSAASLVGGADVSNASAFLDYSASQQCNQSYSSSKRSSRRQQQQDGIVSSSNGDGAVGCSSAHSQGPVALPDFLSDGPMHFSSSSLADGGAHSSSSSPSRGGGSGCSRAGGGSSSAAAGASARPSSSRESEPASQQLERLRRELSEKTRRISQLESDLTRQKSESSMFEAAYLNSEQNLQIATRRTLAAEARVTELSNELQFFKNQLSERLSLKSKSSDKTESGVASSDHSESAAVTRNGRNNNSNTLDSNRVIEIAYSAEYLVGELMDQLNTLKRLALNSPKSEEDHPVPSSKSKSKSKDHPSKH